MKYPAVHIILFFLFATTVLLWIGVFQVSRNCCVLSVWFFDIGQGDAILIQTPGGRQVLIDGGPGQDIVEKLSSAMPFFDRSIDIVVATHPDADHIGGLIDVLKKYDVEYVIWNGVSKDNDVFTAFEREVLREQAQVIKGDENLQIKIGDTISMKILYPPEGLSKTEKSNNTSIVFRMRHNTNNFLFTGDMEKEVEKALVDSGIKLESKVLKVPHHGSKTSSSFEFVETVRPQLAVIQVGARNSYGHPHQKTLETFRALDIPVLRTDKNGDILVKSDGHFLKIKTNRHE